MTNLIDRLCYHLVLLDPRPPSAAGLRGYLLARAGRYAFDGKP